MRQAQPVGLAVVYLKPQRWKVGADTAPFHNPSRGAFRLQIDCRKVEANKHGLPLSVVMVSGIKHHGLVHIPCPVLFHRTGVGGGVNAPGVI